MLSIETQIKLKLYKKKLNSFYYKLVTPLAYIENLMCKRQNKKYEKNQLKISKWTDEFAMNLYSKILVKQMIKHNYRYGAEEVFVVAEYCNHDYDLRMVSDCITQQRKNEDLKSWGYKLPMWDSVRIEKITELLKQELEKYKEITCEYIVDENKYGYCGSRGYIKTLIVRMDKGNAK